MKDALMILCTAMYVAVVAACNQRVNPPVDWPPMPGYEQTEAPVTDAGADRR